MTEKLVLNNGSVNNKDFTPFRKYDVEPAFGSFSSDSRLNYDETKFMFSHATSSQAEHQVFELGKASAKLKFKSDTLLAVPLLTKDHMIFTLYSDNAEFKGQTILKYSIN